MFSFLEYLFFVLEIFTFLYYANEGSDDVIDHSTKTVQHSIKNISGNIIAVFLKHGTRNVHPKRNKMTVMTAGPVLITTEIPRFHLTQGSSTPNNLMGRVKTMWETCLFRGRPPVPLKKVANGDILFFTETDWNQGCCHGNNIVSFCFLCDIHFWCQV